MAVFTPVSEADARSLLSRYNIGELISLRGIAAGIENTNYFLTTTQGRYVLTLFEVLTAEQLPFYFELMHYLAQQNIPVPQPQTLQQGGRLTSLHNKPTTIVTRLNGAYEPRPSVRHCEIAAQTLAHMHLAAKDFSIQQPNLRGLTWWQATAPTLEPFLSQEQQQLLVNSLNEQATLASHPDTNNLPKGPAHCDLFRDNVLFDGSFEQPTMGGFIDFYFAGCDHWIFDVAVTVNDWCIDHSSLEFDPALTQAWLQAYADVRPFTDLEKQVWPKMLRAAALRFWVSRLYDYYMPRPAQTLTPHDPGHFERILRQRHEPVLPQLP